MENLGKVTQITMELLGYQFTFNPIMLVMTWIVMGVLFLLALLGSRKLTMVPGKTQSIFELAFLFLKDITYTTLGDKDGKRYLPFVIAIFFFVLFANWIGVLPNIIKMIGVFIAGIHNLIGTDMVTFTYEGITKLQLSVDPSVWYYSLIKMPAFEEPTKFLATDLSLALLVFLAVLLCGLSSKGIIGYLRGYVDDPFPMKGWAIILFPINPFFYLNIIGSIANVVSHSFRLWGNIFGGGMIIIIVSSLLKFVLMPVGLFAFFGQIVFRIDNIQHPNPSRIFGVPTIYPIG